MRVRLPVRVLVLVLLQVLIRAIGGLPRVSMNASLQHRGPVMLTAGRSTAPQNVYGYVRFFSVLATGARLGWRAALCRPSRLTLSTPWWKKPWLSAASLVTTPPAVPVAAARPTRPGQRTGSAPAERLTSAWQNACVGEFL